MNPATTFFNSPAVTGSLGDAVRAWYCVRVMARREHVTALNLSQRTGVPVFSPRIRVQKKSRSTTPVFATEALFPGYLFARFHYPQEARYVASTPGVLGLVSFGGPPPAVSDDVITHLSAEVQRVAETPAAPLFEEGSWVRIITGCFQGSEGRVLQANPASTRIRVLLNLLGQDIQISMPGEQLAGTSHPHGIVPAGLRAAENPVGNQR